MDKQIFTLNHLREKLVEYVDYWNKEELKLKFIGQYD